MPKINPLDTKMCVDQYLQFLKALKDPISEENSPCTSPEPSTSISTPLYDPEMDEDSKMSANTSSSVYSTEEILRKLPFRGKSNVLRPISSGKNPRKSPRQHASTLAILSSLLYQRKRRSRNRIQEESNPCLPTIFEENILSSTALVEQDRLEQCTSSNIEELTTKVKVKPESPEKLHWRFKPKFNYRAIAQNIDDELDTVFYDFDKFPVYFEDDSVDFHTSRINTSEILRLFEEGKAKETDKSCRRFFNGTPGRKPGRKRKKNLTGWPNKNKRASKREHSKDKHEVVDKTSTADSVSLHEESDTEEEEEEELNRTDITEAPNESDFKNSDAKVDCFNIDRVNKNKTILGKQVKNDVLQPYVYVQKLDNKLISNRICNSKETVKRQRRIPGSPKSPRMLRKPRGRWYKER